MSDENKLSNDIDYTFLIEKEEAVIQICELQKKDEYLIEQMRKSNRFEDSISSNLYVSIRFESKGVSYYLITDPLNIYLSPQIIMFDDLEDNEDEVNNRISNGTFIWEDKKKQFIDRGGLEIYVKYFKEHRKVSKRDFLN